jgi:ADP-heptose:LPS heptosyltransferase
MNTFIPERILLICTDEEVRGCLMFMPVAAALRRNFPEAKMTLLGHPNGIEAARLTGIFTDYLTVDWEFGKPDWADRKAQLRMLSQIRSAGYDLGIASSGESALANALMFLGGVKTRVGFRNAKLRWMLHKRLDAPESENEGIRNIRLLTGVGLPPNIVRPTSEISPEALTHARELLGAALNNADLGDDRILIHMGAADKLRRWPTSHFAELAARLYKTKGVRPILLEEADESGMTNKIFSMIDERVAVIKRVPSMEVLAAIIRMCHLFVGAASTALHLSYLVGRSSVSLWGPTNPELYGNPYSKPDCTILRSPVPCACCEAWNPDRRKITQLIGSNALCRREGISDGVYPCMGAITVDMVYDAIQEIRPKLPRKRPKNAEKK